MPPLLRVLLHHFLNRLAKVLRRLLNGDQEERIERFRHYGFPLSELSAGSSASAWVFPPCGNSPSSLAIRPEPGSITSPRANAGRPWGRPTGPARYSPALLSPAVHC